MPVMEREVRYCATRDGVRIAYSVAGSGPPLLRLPVPGATHIEHDWQTFQRVLPALSGRFRLAWYDARGTGLSQRDIHELTIDGLMADADAVVKAAAFGRVSLLAFGAGVDIALWWASRNPEQVQHVVLVDAVSGSWELNPTAKALARMDWDIYTETLAKVFMGIDEPDYVRQLAAQYRDATTQDMYLRYIDFWAAAEDPPLDFEATTLVVNNRDLPWAPFEYSQKIAVSLPNARLVRVDDKLYDDLPRLVENFILGATDPAISSAPSAFRTVLFTDLVGHTEMMSRLGDERGRQVLREHEDITRSALRQYGGTEVKTMGDGFMASFGSVTKAVECAIALQRAFAERNSSAHPEALEGLAVRVGLNAGEPIEEDGDLFGATVILASRIAAKAQGGDILVSDTVRGLCSGKGFLFADRGEFAAKGFEEPVRVYEVSWRG